MQASANDLTIPDGMDAAEWQTRCDTAATYRLQAKYRMTDLTGGFIGGRIAGNGHFVVKPSYQFAEEVRASDLVKANLDHEVVGNGVPNDASLHTCASIFAARPDLNGLVHVHSRASAAIATLESGLQPMCQAAFMFYRRIGYADFDYDLNQETCHLLVEALGPHKAVLMRHHGMLTAGRTPRRGVLCRLLPQPGVRHPALDDDDRGEAAPSSRQRRVRRSCTSRTRARCTPTTAQRSGPAG